MTVTITGPAFEARRTFRRDATRAVERFIKLHVKLARLDGDERRRRTEKRFRCLLEDKPLGFSVKIEREPAQYRRGSRKIAEQKI